MGVIHHTPNDPIQLKIQDLSVPVLETLVFCGMFKDLRDAELVTGVPRADILAACASKKPVKGYAFALPDLKRVSHEFPNYRVVHHPVAAAQARPTTVHTQTLGKYGKRVDIDYRTMRAARVVWDLNEKRFESIVARSHGWRDLCPPAVCGITVHPPGWQPPKGRVFTAMGTAKSAPLPPAFELRQLKNSVVWTHVGPTSAPTIRDVPGYVLSNCILK